MRTAIKDTIRQNNDAFRSSFCGYGRVILTSGIFNDKNKAKVINAVKVFNNFNEDNDPYGEHDFGKISIDGEDYFWKIDYYDNAICEYGFMFEDNKPDKAFRILTIMLADEY